MAVLFLAAGLLIHWRSGYNGLDLDFSSLISRVYRVAIGQIIYRDFDCVITPTTCLVQGWLLRLSGFNLAAMRWYVSFQGAIMCVLTFALLRRTLNLATADALFAAVISLLWSAQLSWGMPWYTLDANFFTLLALGILLWAWGRESRASSFSFGLSCSMVFWCKQDIGGAAMVLGTAIFFFQAVRRGADGKRPLLLSYAAGAALPFLLFAAYFGFHGGLQDAWYSIMRRAVIYKLQRGSLGFTPSGTVFQRLLWTLDARRSLCGKLLLLIYAAAFLLPWIGRESPTAAPPPNFPLRDSCASLFAGGIYYAGFLTHGAGYFDMLQPCLGCIVGIVCGRLDPPAAAPSGSGRNPGKWKPLFLVFTAVLSLRTYKYIVSNNIHPERNFAGGDPALAGMRFEKSYVAPMDSLIRFVKEKIPATESFCILPPDQDFVYLATRRTPAQPVTCTGEWFAEDQTRIIEGLEGNRVRWLFVLGNDPSDAAPPVMPRLRRYVAEQFKEFQRIGDGILVLRRDSGNPSGPR